MSKEKKEKKFSIPELAKEIDAPKANIYRWISKNDTLVTVMDGKTKKVSENVVNMFKSYKASIEKKNGNGNGNGNGKNTPSESKVVMELKKKLAVSEKAVKELQEEIEKPPSQTEEEKEKVFKEMEEKCKRYKKSLTIARYVLLGCSIVFAALGIYHLYEAGQLSFLGI
jgi:protein-tyrosine-phosphatase